MRSRLLTPLLFLAIALNGVSATAGSLFPCDLSKLAKLPPIVINGEDHGKDDLACRKNERDLRSLADRHKIGLVLEGRATDDPKRSEYAMETRGVNGLTALVHVSYVSSIAAWDAALYPASDVRKVTDYAMTELSEAFTMNPDVQRAWQSALQKLRARDPAMSAAETKIVDTLSSTRKTSLSALKTIAARPSSASQLSEILNQTISAYLDLVKADQIDLGTPVDLTALEKDLKDGRVSRKTVMDIMDTARSRLFAAKIAKAYCDYAAKKNAKALHALMGSDHVDEVWKLLSEDESPIKPPLQYRNPWLYGMAAPPASGQLNQFCADRKI